MRNIVISQDKKLGTILALAGVISVSVGIAIRVSPIMTIAVSILFLVILFIYIYNKLYDLSLWVLAFVYLAVQFQITAVEALRFVFLLAIVLFSLLLLRKHRVPLNNVVIGLALLGFYAVCTSFLSSYLLVAFLKGVSLILLAAFLMLMPPALNQLYPQKSSLKHVLELFSYLIVIVVISSIIYYFLFPESSNQRLGGTALLNGRFRGWFTNPNDIATFLGVFSIPILLFQARNQKSKLVKSAIIFVLLLTAGELIATQSRSGILAGFISMMVFILLSKNQPSRVLVISLIIIFAVLVILLKPNDNFLRAFIFRNEVNLEGSGRIAYWIAAWNRFLLKPVFGSGFGVSIGIINKVSFVFSSNEFSIQKDNSYIAALEELGIVGNLMLWLILLLPLAQICLRSIRSARMPPYEPKTVLVAVISAGMFNAVFESWLLSPGNIFCLSFWLFSAFICHTKKIEQNPPL